MICDIADEQTLPLYLTREEAADIIDFIEFELVGAIQRSADMIDDVNYVVNLCNVLCNLRTLYKTFEKREVDGKEV